MNDKQTLTPEAGKFYRTRNGLRAFVASIDAFGAEGNGPSPYVSAGFVQGSGAVTWTRDGKQTNFSDSPADLVAEWVEPKRIKGWVNIYPAGQVSDVHPTRQVADQESNCDRCACVEIDVLEGHGLNGEAA